MPVSSNVVHHPSAQDCVLSTLSTPRSDLLPTGEASSANDQSMRGNPRASTLALVFDLTQAEEAELFSAIPPHLLNRMTDRANTRTVSRVIRADERSDLKLERFHAALTRKGLVCDENQHVRVIRANDTAEFARQLGRLGFKHNTPANLRLMLTAMDRSQPVHVEPNALHSIRRDPSLPVFIEDEAPLPAPHPWTPAEANEVTLASTSKDEALRPDYGSSKSDISELFETLSSTLVYNTQQAFDVNVDITWPELTQIRDHALTFVRDNNLATVILPYAKEENTASLNHQYATETIAPENVWSISAINDPLSDQRVADFIQTEAPSSHLAQQRDILDCVNWRAVCESAGIVMNVDASGNVMPPKGTKGLTMLAGLLHAWAKDQLRPWVVFHDTDITNPTAYDALAYLFLPLALAHADGKLALNSAADIEQNTPQSSDSPLGINQVASYMAKTGPDRHNESQTLLFNAIANDHNYTAGQRQAARLMSRAIWPLTGERLVASEMLLNMPWSTGMSIENNINLFLANQEMAADRPMIHQCFSALSKAEHGIAKPVREFALLQRCANWPKEIWDHENRTNTRFPQWDIPTIREFNEHMQRTPLDGLYQNEGDSLQGYQHLAKDAMLPSVQQMANEGWIDKGRLMALGHLPLSTTGR